MKNLKATALSLFCTAALLTGCGTASGNTPPSTDDQPLQVVVTNFAAYDFARGAAGDLADISILLPPGADSHSYEPSPADIIAIDQSDLFIYLGGESDDWVDSILASTDRVNTVRMMGAEITLLNEDAHVHTDECDHDDDDHVHTDECDHDDDDHVHTDECDHDDDAHVHTDECDHDDDAHVHTDECDHDDDAHDHDDAVSTVVSSATNLGAVTSYDEHIWTSPSNATAVVAYLSNAFSEVDPDNAETYSANSQAYGDKITAMGAEFTAFFDTVEEKIMVIGDRFPLKYFATEYGIEYYAAFPGCSSETEPSAATMAFLIDLVDDHDLDTVYQIEFSNGLVAKAIADATGAQTATFHACDNFTKEEIDSGITYVDLMYQNLETLKNTMK